MISVVCVYNNELTFKNVLLKSLESQSAEYELIPVDNRNENFKSAAEALNCGAMNARGKYIMFVHQDVSLGYIGWLEDAEAYLDSLPDAGVAGVAGVCSEYKTWRDNFRYSLQFVNRLNRENGNITRPEEVQTLDECVLIVPRPVFDKIKFDSSTFDGWDCYGTDYCLSVKNICLKSYVLPLPCSHSTMRSRYKVWEFRDLIKYQKKLHKKYRAQYREISAWMGKISWLDLKLYSALMLLGPIYSRLLFHSSGKVLERELRGCDSILDLGCGWDPPVKEKTGFYSVGVDISISCLQEARRLGNNDSFIQADLNKLEFKPKSFDAVISVNAIEYLTKEAGSELIEKMKGWARKKVIIVTRNGHDPQPPEKESLYYKSYWSADEFRQKGFRVRGLSGWKHLKDSNGSQKYRPALFWERVSELTQNIIYYFPDRASRLLAVKKIDNN